MLNLLRVKHGEGYEKMAQLFNGNEVVAPSKADTALAKESSQRLAVYLSHTEGFRLEVKTDVSDRTQRAPNSFFAQVYRVRTL